MEDFLPFNINQIMSVPYLDLIQRHPLFVAIAVAVYAFLVVRVSPVFGTPLYIATAVLVVGVVSYIAYASYNGTGLDITQTTSANPVAQANDPVEPFSIFPASVGNWLSADGTESYSIQNLNGGTFSWVVTDIAGTNGSNANITTTTEFVTVHGSDTNSNPIEALITTDLTVSNTTPFAMYITPSDLQNASQGFSFWTTQFNGSTAPLIELNYMGNDLSGTWVAVDGSVTYSVTIGRDAIDKFKITISVKTNSLPTSTYSSNLTPTTSSDHIQYYVGFLGGAPVAVVPQSNLIQLFQFTGTPLATSLLPA